MNQNENLNSSKIREILKKRDYAVLKKFGQNFIIDGRILNDICFEIIKRASSDNVIYEIGPGLGSLTQKFLSNSKQVVAFEIDKGLCNILEEMFIDSELKVIQGDAIKTLFSSDYRPHCLCGNLPYNIGTLIITKILEFGINGFYPDNMIFLLQKEVAEKFCAKEGGKNFSSLGILTNLSYDCRKIFDVKRSAFYPIPNVTSSLIVFEKKKSMVFDLQDEKLNFIKFVRLCFANRRKNIKNNMMNAKLENVDQILQKAGIFGTKRAEELNMNDFIKLNNVINLFNEKTTGK